MRPFEARPEEIESNLDHFVDMVFASLASGFMVMPRGSGFVDYATFEQGYEVVKRNTQAFSDVSATSLLSAVMEMQVSLIVIRTILGFTPPEWAYITTQTQGAEVSQSFARSLDRKVRVNPLQPLKNSERITLRVNAMLAAAAQFMREGAQEAKSDHLHRLDKADTCEGLRSICAAASLGVPYAMLLYERFLGRPFAGHRDSVSELVGDVLETAVEEVLSKAGISFRKTKRAETIPGFDQAPDFVIPSEFSPKVVIEAKITEDDGTARDKVTRIQHLAQLGAADAPGGKQKFEVIGCIAGRGFAVRRSDMKKLILATRGKVFTLQDLEMLVDCSALSQFKTKT